MSQSNVICREVRQEDYEGVHALRASEGMGDRDSPQLWGHLYFENPALKRHPGHWPLGWVLESDGRIVGYIGNIPQVYAYEGKTLFGALGSGMVVHPEYRGKSRGHTARMIRCYCDQPADFLFNTTANLPAGKLWSSWGFTEVPCTDLTAVFSRATPASARAALHRKKVPPALARWIRVPVSVLWDLKNRLGGMRFRGKGPVRQIEGFDERFDRFWAEFSARQRDKLVKVGDRQMLSWHFDGVLQRYGGVIIIREDFRGELTGYAVLAGFPSKDPFERRYRLADLKTLDLAGEILDELLLNVFQVCRENRVDYLAIRGFPDAVRSRIARLHPYWGKAARGAFLKVPASGPHSSLLEPGRWYFTPYDGDSIV